MEINIERRLRSVMLEIRKILAALIVLSKKDIFVSSKLKDMIYARLIAEMECCTDLSFAMLGKSLDVKQIAKELKRDIHALKEQKQSLHNVIISKDKT